MSICEIINENNSNQWKCQWNNGSSIMWKCESLQWYGLSSENNEKLAIMKANVNEMSNVNENEIEMKAK